MFLQERKLFGGCVKTNVMFRQKICFCPGNIAKQTTTNQNDVNYHVTISPEAKPASAQIKTAGIAFSVSIKIELST